MSPQHGEAAAIIFGLDPLWLSTIILIGTYAVLLSERIHRTVVALLGAGLMIISGILNQDQAFAGIDFNTIALLTGMMMIVAITRQTGVFEFVAIWSAKRVKADPRGVLMVLSVVTALFSAFLDNLNNSFAGRAGCASDRRQAESISLSLHGFTDIGLECGRHGNPYRRSAQHPYRIGHRADVH